MRGPEKASRSPTQLLSILKPTLAEHKPLQCYGKDLGVLHREMWNSQGLTAKGELEEGNQ